MNEKMSFGQKTLGSAKQYLKRNGGILIGLIAICQKGYTALGNVAIFAIAAPLLVSIVRVHNKDKAEAAKK